MADETENGRAGRRTPRILMITPELAFVPKGMGKASRAVAVRIGEPADTTAALLQALFELGADVHAAVPNYRNIFRRRALSAVNHPFGSWTGSLRGERIHLAQDRAFFYPTELSPDPNPETIRIALAFQREVLNRILPEVRPDLVHCQDWTSGLIPAMTRELGTPCLYTLNRVKTARLTLAAIEDRGIDAASFWRNC